MTDPPVVRQGDPETSMLAAEALSDRLGNARLVLAVIQAHPGIIAGEVGELLPDMSGAWKRCSDCKTWGWVTVGEKRRYEGTGRMQETLWPVSGVEAASASPPPPVDHEIARRWAAMRELDEQGRYSLDDMAMCPVCGGPSKLGEPLPVHKGLVKIGDRWYPRDSNVIPRAIEVCTKCR